MMCLETDFKIRRLAARLILGIILTIGTMVTGCSYPLDLSHCPLIWGRITRHGTAVNDALIVYTPEGDELGATWIVTPLGADGSYRITTDDRGSPLVTGWYKISFILNQFKKPSATPEKDKAATESRRDRKKTDGPSSSEDSSRQAKETNSSDSAGGAARVSKAYFDPKTTPLKLWVRAQTMRVDIDLLD